MRGLRLLVGAMLATAMAGCDAGPTTDHLGSVLDEVRVPAVWQLAEESASGRTANDDCSTFFNVECPRVARLYVTDTQASRNLAAATDAVRGAGFTVNEVYSQSCDAPPSAPSCGFLATRGADTILVNIYASADRAAFAGNAPPSAGAVELRAYPTP